MNPRKAARLRTYAILVFLVLAVLLLPFACLHAQQVIQRTYWVRSVDSLATGRVLHTHVQTTGRVSLVSRESDGDVHIRLTAASGRFIVCECVPEWPCVLPRVGDTVTVKGIYRRDPEHLWFEVHPVEAMTRGGTVLR